MTERDKNLAIWCAISGGIIKLVSATLWTIFGVKGVWFVGASMSHVLFWLAFTILFEKDRKARDLANFFLLLATNDLIDELFFDNTVFGWNEAVFFLLIITWYCRKLYKCIHSKNGS